MADVPAGYRVVSDVPKGYREVESTTMSDRVAARIENISAGKDVDFDFGTMVENIPSSAANVAKDLWHAISNPVDTATGIGRAALGGAQMLIPGEQEYEPYAEAVGQHFANRYGDANAIKQTLMDDPYGVVGDTAGLLSGIGTLPKMGKVGQLGAAIDPVNQALRGMPKSMMNLPGMQGYPASLYNSAAKFYKKYDGPGMSQRAIDYGIMPTEGGIQKIQNLTGAIDDQISSMIDSSVKAGERINATDVLKHIKGVEKEMTNFNLDAATNKSQIQAVVDNFNEMVESQGKTTVTASEMQNFKREIYNSIKWDRTRQTGSMATENARKAIAMGAKEAIEKVMPEVKDLNLEWGDLIELQEALEGPASRIGRRDVIGLGATSKGILGGVTADVPGAIGGFIIGLADNPTLKARIAMQLEEVKNLKVSDANKRVMAIEILRNAGAMPQYEDENALQVQTQNQ